MKQVFPFMILLSLCFMVSCDKCTKETTPSRKTTMDKKYPQLSTEEQAFAKKLSSEHKTIFCEKFSESQRATTMKLYNMNECKKAGKCGSDQTLLTPDEAVEQIYRGHRMHIKEE